MNLFTFSFNYQTELKQFSQNYWIQSNFISWILNKSPIVSTYTCVVLLLELFWPLVFVEFLLENNWKMQNNYREQTFHSIDKDVLNARNFAHTHTNCIANVTIYNCFMHWSFNLGAFISHESYSDGVRSVACLLTSPRRS